MFAAGIGVTPLRALLDQAVPSREVTLVYRVSANDHLLFADELAAFAADGLELVVLAGPRRAEFSWLPEGTEGDTVEAMKRLVPRLLESDVLVSGPPAWADVVVQTARAAGVARRDIHREDFA